MLSRFFNADLILIGETQIKLYTFYSNDFLPLKKRFSRTLKDNFDVEYIFFDKKEVGYGTGGGYTTWIYKTELLIKLIEENISKIIVFSDIDIQFFKKTEKIIEECLIENDIVFQGENKFKEANIGFIACRCNNEVLGFWKEVLVIVSEKKRWDQQVVNDLLFSGYSIKWGYFPDSIWNWHMSPCWKSIVLHHSIGAGDLKLKLFQMKIVWVVYYLKWLNNFNITFKYSRKIYRIYKNHRRKVHHKKFTFI